MCVNFVICHEKRTILKISFEIQLSLSRILFLFLSVWRPPMSSFLALALWPELHSFAHKGLIHLIGFHLLHVIGRVKIFSKNNKQAYLFFFHFNIYIFFFLNIKPLRPMRAHFCHLIFQLQVVCGGQPYPVNCHLCTEIGKRRTILHTTVRECFGNLTKQVIYLNVLFPRFTAVHFILRGR